MGHWKRYEKPLLGVAACLAVSIALGYLLVLSPKAEPVFNGEPESFWVDTLPSNYLHVSELGSNAVPVLLKAVERRQDPIARAYQKLWPKFPGWMQTRWPRPIDAAAVRMAAAQTLSGMGDVKTLISILKNNSDPKVRMCALQRLISNSERAVTLALIEALHDKDSRVRAEALLGLGMTDRDRDPAVPAMVECLRDGNPEVRLWAVRVLCMDRHGFEAAFPGFKRSLKDPDKRVRDAAAEALKYVTFSPRTP